VTAVVFVVGGETKAAPSKKGKASAAASAEDIPLILTDTYQRLDSYSKGVKNLFHAVSILLMLIHCTAPLCSLHVTFSSLRSLLSVTGQRAQHEAHSHAQRHDQAHT
jgi:hypothetical protein